MGTTASTLAILPEGAVVAHVGDSRIYRLRRGVFEQLTFDHSLVWEMEASGQVHPNSALGQSIPKNVITRSLGPNAEVMVDIEGPFQVEEGDRFLLCSDGLSGQVDDTEMAALVDCLPEELAARVLVDLANLRGGPDNSTVIIVRIEEGAEHRCGDESVTASCRQTHRAPAAAGSHSGGLCAGTDLGCNQQLGAHGRHACFGARGERVLFFAASGPSKESRGRSTAAKSGRRQRPVSSLQRCCDPRAVRAIG